MNLDVVLATPIVRRPPAEGPFERPLSGVEEDVFRVAWELSQGAPTTFAQLASASRLEGPFDVEAMKRAITMIDERHDIWRTQYEMRPDGPVAHVLPTVEPTLRVVECATEEAALETFRRASEVGFDLKHASLHRWLIIRVSDEVHFLCHLVHHIACDGYALLLLFRELYSLYHAYKAGEAPTLPATPLQYSDLAFADQVFQDPELQAQHATFWKQQRLSTPLPAPIAAMRPRPDGQQTFRAAHRPISLAVGPALAELCRTRDVAMVDVLLAALTVVLRDEGANGSPIGFLHSSRGRYTMRTMGNFTKFIALRGPVETGATWDAVLQTTASMRAECVRHANVSPPMRPDQPAPFRVYLNYFSRGVSPEPTELKVTNAGFFGKQRVRFDLELNFVLDRANDLVVIVDYNTELIDEPVLLGFIQRYEAALLAITADSTQLA